MLQRQLCPFFTLARMQVDQVNSEGLASAPWPARHNDPPRVTAVTCS